MCSEAERLDRRPRAVTASDHAWPEAVSVREAVIRIEALLRAHGVTADPAGLAALVIAEALNNVTEHAFAEAPADWIRIDLKLDGARLDIDIADCGAPMPGLAAPDARPADLDVARDALPEGGFGWFLIRHLTRDLAYIRDGGINRLSLTFDLDALGGAELPN